MRVIEPTKGRRLTHWAQIHWTRVETNVRRLQGRIYRAAANHEHRKVKNLQKLLVRSMSAKLKAIRQVTQENNGKQTPGIDGVVCDTPQKRLELLKDGLRLKGYRPKPVKRCYIPKSNGGQRPLGIPTQKDRVMQALVKLALEPEWESRFEANSYGFRPGRCTMDALTALHTCMNRKGASQWILDADIKGCFDNIEHSALLTRLSMFTTTIRRWLKAGVVELGHYTHTEAGTPQGGVATLPLQSCQLFFSGSGSPRYGSTRNTILPCSCATSTRFTSVRIRSRLLAQSASSKPSCTLVAQSSSRPIISGNSAYEAASSMRCWRCSSRRARRWRRRVSRGANSDLSMRPSA